MFVYEACVPMGVRVRFARWIARRVFMLMMLIVHVRVGMLSRLVVMSMLVMFGEMQPHAHAH